MSYSYDFTSKVAVAVPESTFWRIVDPIKWGTKTRDYNAVRQYLMKALTPQEAAGFATTFRKIKDKLDKKLSKEVSGLGDDGYNDLLAHIIGMGKTEYEAVMKNPELGVDRADKHQFAESFAYAIPTERDYQFSDVKVQLGRAKRILDSYETVLKMDREEVLWRDPIEAPLKRIVFILDKFLTDKDPIALLEQEAEAKQASEEIEKEMRRVMYTEKESKKFLEVFEDLSNKWIVWNFFADMRELAPRALTARYDYDRSSA